MFKLTRFLPIAQHAVDIAADMIRTRQPGVLTMKGDRDAVTELEYAIENTVRDYLRAETPDITFVGEESGASSSDTELMWALDPIDGTMNFLHRLPLYAVSLGLIQRHRPVLGVIDLPLLLGQRFHAVEGSGSFEGGRRISVATPGRLCDAIVSIGDYAVGDSADHKNLARFAVTRQLASVAQRVRMHGSAAIDLAWLASGRLDAVIILSNTPWDTSAGVIIAREAGAQVVDAEGTPHTANSATTIAASPPILMETLAVVQAAVATVQCSVPR